MSGIHATMLLYILGVIMLSLIMIVQDIDHSAVYN